MAPENVSGPVYQTVVSTLAEIQSLLEDVARICSRYGLERIDEIQPGQPQESEREIKRQATIVDSVQKSCSLYVVPTTALGGARPRKIRRFSRPTHTVQRCAL